MNVRSIALIGPLADDAASMLGSWAGLGKNDDVIRSTLHWPNVSGKTFASSQGYRRDYRIR